MDLAITDTIIAALLVGVGWIIKQVWESLKESRGRRKSEVQKLTDERDHYRTLKRRWKSAYYALEYKALRRGISQDELPDTPDDDN